MSLPIINSKWEFIHLQETMDNEWRLVPPDEDELPFNHEFPEEDLFPSIAHALNHFGKEGYGFIGSPDQEMLGGRKMILSRHLTRKEKASPWRVTG